jgi:hypothetical protein
MSAARDPDELTRAEAVALYAELEQRAAALRPSPKRARRPPRRLLVLAPVMAGLAIAAAVASNSLNGSNGPGPASIPGPANGPQIVSGPLTLVPGERVRSIARNGATTTIRYRSGLVEVITPRRSIPTAHGPDATGPPAIDVTLGNHRILLSGLDTARLQQAARTLGVPSS